MKDIQENIISEYSLIDLVALNIKNSKKLISILKNVKNDQMDSFLIDFLFENILNNKVREVRELVVKILGRLRSADVASRLIKHYSIESDSLVKREIISSVGRMRDDHYLYFFNDVLKESDPKLVLQGIRSLLALKKNSQTEVLLHSLKNHSNEMIKEVLNIELNKVKVKREKDHAKVNPLIKNTIVNGDVISTLKNINDESFHLTFTSPPYYNARDYSFYNSYEEYLEFLRDVFKEVHRLTKNGRFLIVNSSPVIVPRVSRAHSSKRYPIPFDLNKILTDDGWEFIDDIVWQKPEYSVKNRIGGFMQNRKPLSYKPNCVTEYVMVYRKKTTDLIDWNLKQYENDVVEESKVEDGYETTNVWKIDPKNDRIHSAVFPKGLCERIIKYYSFKNDLVFDPFGGSGTLAEVALNLGRNIFMTEIDEEYFIRIKQRLTSFDNINYIKLNEFNQWMKRKE